MKDFSWPLQPSMGVLRLLSDCGNNCYNISNHISMTFLTMRQSSRSYGKNGQHHLKKFRSYLLPKAFIILTLEHNLPYAIQHMSISPRVSKWVLELQEYDYSFIVEDSTRASLADVLTYKVREKKVTKAKEEKIYLPQEDLEEAHTLYFDGAYRRQLGKAAGGIIILSPSKEVIMKKGITLKDAHSNNEAEYFTLIFGLE